MKLLFKLVLIGALLLVLAIPVMMLQGLVGERQQRGREAVEDIARSSSRAQTLVGPLLRVEIERRVRRVRMHGDGTPADVQIVRERDVELVTPATLDVEGTLATERRRRGLFEAIVFHADLDLVAQFDAFRLPEAEAEVVEHRVVAAALVLGLGDMRGVRAAVATIGAVGSAVEPGTGLGWLPVGVQVPLDPARLDARFDARIELELGGTGGLQWVAAGDESRIALDGDWPHPSFTGEFLPTHRDVGSADVRKERARPTHRDVGSADARVGANTAGTGGFRAEWKISRLASQAATLLRGCPVAASSCAGMQEAAFGLRLIDPVDRYLKTERAIKYAWLFIVLVLGALFLLELLRPVRLHPLQYGMTGLALAMFFLLLLSLSDHIGFGPAYLIAATACVILVASHVAPALGSRWRAGGFSALVAALYALLYGLLQSEDYALLMGALALFGLLAGAMLLTRRVDWYRLGEPPRAAEGA
jgi:inner membrane protein